MKQLLKFVGIVFLAALITLGLGFLPRESPWMTVQVYRDSLEMYLDGKKAILRDTQTIFNRKYTIKITKDHD